MRRMMDKMGLNVNEIDDVQEVLIRTDKKEIVIEKPIVAEMKGQGNTMFTVTTEDEYSERELETQNFSDEDVQLVCDETGVDEETAKNALAEADGDLARAILLLKD